MTHVDSIVRRRRLRPCGLTLAGGTLRNAEEGDNTHDTRRHEVSQWQRTPDHPTPTDETSEQSRAE